MATARKSKKTVDAATPPVTVSDDFLMPKKAKTKNKSAAKKQKPSSDFPKNVGKCQTVSFADMMDRFAGAKVVAKATMRKVETYESELKKFLLERFAAEWAKNGTRPESHTWKGNRSKLDYVMTSRITFNEDKQEELEELGIDMADEFGVQSLTIDFNAVKNNEKHMAALKAFVKALGDDAEDLVERKYGLNSDFFNSLAKKCDNNESRLLEALKILSPAANFNGVSTSDKEEDLFDLLKQMNG